MPAVSKAQKRFMKFCKHTDHPPDKCPDRETAGHFTKTPDKGLPERKTKRKKRPLYRGD